MAKEIVFKFKVQVDGKEIEQTIGTVDEFKSRISDLQKRLNAAPIGSKQFIELQNELKRTEASFKELGDGIKEYTKNFQPGSITEYQQKISDLQNQISNTPLNSQEYKKLQKELKSTENAFGDAKMGNQSFLDNLSQMPGILGTVGQSIQGAGKLFSSFNMVLKTSVIGLIATVIAKVVEKLSQMSGVLDPLTKITDIFSGVLGNLANAVMKPLIFVIEGVVKGVELLADAFGRITGLGEGYGSALGKISEELDALEDSQSSFNLELQKANRQLQEAREIAADETKTYEERRKALVAAGEQEEKIAQANKKRALERARLNAAQLAGELGFSKQRIEAIKNYDQAALESFSREIAGYKNLNQEKLDQLYGYIGEVENISADEARIGKKVQSQLKSINSQEEADRKAKADAARQAAQKRRQDLIAEYDAEIKLLTTFQQNSETKNKAYYDSIRAQLEDYYKKKNALEDQDKKLSKAALDLRTKEQKTAIEASIKSLIDSDNAILKLDQDVIKSSEAVAEARVTASKNIITATEEQQKKLDAAYQSEVTRLNNLMSIYQVDSEMYKKLQIEKNNAEADYIKKTKENDLKIEEGKKAQAERLANIDKQINDLQTTNLKEGLDKQILLIEKAGKEKIDAYKKQVIESLAAGDIATQEEADKKIAEYTAAILEGTTRDVNKMRKEALLKSFEDEVNLLNLQNEGLNILEEEYWNNRAEILDMQMQRDLAMVEKGSAEELAILQKYKDLKIKLKSEESAAYGQVATAVIDSVVGLGNALASSYDQEAETSEAAFNQRKKLQKATALMSAAGGIIQILTQPSTLPSPIDYIVKAANAAALAVTTAVQVSKINATQFGGGAAAATPRALADGGVVYGAGTSTSDSIPARLSKGESVINAKSTSMFAPLLSAINEAGGGRSFDLSMNSSNVAGRTFQFGGLSSPIEYNMNQQSRMLSDVVSSINSQPVKTYVVATDMSNQQMFDRAARTRSTL
jgi:hypothetical protein